jgi:N-acetylglucosaminyl-diphospho-decaprenol L-rhamnosyltransferase
VLSVVVLSWNTQALTLACLRALYAETPRHAREVIVVDNGSHDGSADAIAAAYPQVRLERNADNRLYAAGNNQGAVLASGEFLCTLNSDTEVRPGALDRLVDFLRENPAYGPCAPKLVDPDGSVQHACQRFPTLLTALCALTRGGAPGGPAAASRRGTSCATSTTRRRATSTSPRGRCS